MGTFLTNEDLKSIEKSLNSRKSSKILNFYLTICILFILTYFFIFFYNLVVIFI